MMEQFYIYSGFFSWYHILGVEWFDWEKFDDVLDIYIMVDVYSNAEVYIIRT